jgi:hypothetical protein
MKIINKIILVVFIQFLSHSAHAQGFINLNFESANVSGFSTGSVPAANAFPGWTAYIAGVQQSSVIYDTIPLDNAAVTLQGTNSDSLMPIQGDFTAWLFGSSSFASQQQSAGLGQTGQIPVNAESLIFWGYAGSTDVSFDNQTLSLLLLGSTANYDIYGANISAFAGETGQLLFTAQPGENDEIDNIQFSPSSVPEPNSLALCALAGLFLAWRRWKTRVI